MEPTPYERRRRRRGAWWLWLVAALLLLALLIALLARGCGDDGDSASFENVLAASNGSLAEFDGKDVDVSSGEVTKVVEDSGFWVGSGDQRVFVEVEDEQGTDVENVQEGDSVSFNGVVEQNIPAEDYGLTGEDARLYDAQGRHIRVQAGDVEVG